MSKKPSQREPNCGLYLTLDGHDGPLSFEIEVIYTKRDEKTQRGNDEFIPCIYSIENRQNWLVRSGKGMTRRGHTHTERKLEEKKKQRIKFETYVCFGNHFNYKPKISFDIKSFARLLYCTVFSGGNVLTFCGVCTFSLLFATHIDFNSRRNIPLEDSLFPSIPKQGGNSSHTVCVWVRGQPFFRQVTTHIHTLRIYYLWTWITDGRKKRKKRINSWKLTVKDQKIIFI